jgi:hypothetical protein
MADTNTPTSGPFGYVTYNPETGNLTGSYFQVLQAEHADNHIAVSDAERDAWVNFRMNEARDGLEPLPPVAPTDVVFVPREVTRRQALQALYIKHKLTEDMLDAKIIEVISDPDAQYLARLELKTSQSFERNRPLVIAIGAALNLDLDLLFTFAATL